MKPEDVDAIRKLDKVMISQLRQMAKKSGLKSFDMIADRMEKLTAKAHDRLHWTGSE
tara:strand:+ start:1072 stop:1242 length:171 start_codon:yes stop_codon:yes gene_type:complete